MTKTHPQRDNMLLAADNKDQLFECDEYENCNINAVLTYPKYNWRPVKTTKKIKRWLWSSTEGAMTSALYSEDEIKENRKTYTTKLTWSETIFEVSDD